MPNAQVEQNLGADAVVTQVRPETEALVSLHGIEILLLLKPVRLELGQETDAAPFLTHVQDHPLARLLHLLHGRMELGAAIAAQAVEDVAGQALAMHAHQNRFGLYRDLAVHLQANAALAQGQVWLAIDHRGIGEQILRAAQHYRITWTAECVNPLRPRQIEREPWLKE